MTTRTRHEARIDREPKTLADDAGTGHNRWHPDIPPVLCCDPGDEVVLETRDAFDGQLGPDATLETLSPRRTSTWSTRSPARSTSTAPSRATCSRSRSSTSSPTVTATPSRFPDSASCATCSPTRSRSAGTSPTAGRPLPTCPGSASPASPFMGTIGLSPGHACSRATTAREQALLDRGGFVLPPVRRRPPSRPTRASRPRRCARSRRASRRQRRHQTARQGRTALIPVDTPGGLFSAGDAHFAQGDCETCGTAIEMRATLHVRFTVHKGEAARRASVPAFTQHDYYLPPEFAAPRRFFATTGISVTKDGENHAEDVTLAARNALLNMIDHLTERGWTPPAGLRHLQRRRRPQDQPARRRPEHARVRIPARRHLHQLRQDVLGTRTRAYGSGA